MPAAARSDAPTIVTQPVRLVDADGKIVAEGIFPMIPGEWPLVVMLEGQAYRPISADLSMIVYQRATQWIADGSLRRAGALLQ